MEMNNELIAKAKQAKTPEELLALAKENGIEMTEESANAYFKQFNPKMGELADEELDNVAGGSCYASDGRMVTSLGAGTFCDNFCCKKDNGRRHSNICGFPYCTECGAVVNCGQCKLCSYEKGLWLCNSPKNMK